ncbi:serine hydrolase domain-containing protein [Emcibacter sp.]|uniref:serine hydrolase domain-containing protein n=1 Tax=Emcibacter sp. TaxID=1979954 RepID=UPI003A8D0D4D
MTIFNQDGISFSRPLWTACLGIFLTTVTLQAAAATEPTPETVKSQVAGYKAAFTCSATFNGGKSADMIRQDELTGIRLDYRKYMAELPDAEINQGEKYVSVRFSEDLPPRYAVWRPGLGCAQLPPGADLSVRKHVPSVNFSSAPDNGVKPWPVGDAVPEPDMAPSPLQAVLNDAFTTEKYGDPKATSATLVTTPDRLLAEQYKAGFTPHTSQRTWSVAKSISATVIGIAVEKGLLDIKAPANIPEWSAPGDPRQKITLENLLHMASGLDSNKAGNRTSYVYFGGGLVTDNATEKMLETAPGKRWKYANNDTLLAVRSLKATLGETEAMLRFPTEQLFRKIGMGHTVAETDWQGNFVLSSQVWSTARDLARLGILYLNDGVWQGEKLLPDWWREFVSTPAPSQPPLVNGEGHPLPGYGAQFWLFDSRFPGLPDDVFAMAGNRGQYVMIIPSRNLVIVRRGYDSPDGVRFNIAAFTADILAALNQ